MQFTYLTTVLLATVATAAPVPNINSVDNALEVREAGLPGLAFVQGLVEGVATAQPGTKLPALGGKIKREAGDLPGVSMITGLLKLKGGLPVVGKRYWDQPPPPGAPGKREAAALPEADATPDWQQPPAPPVVPPGK